MVGSESTERLFRYVPRIIKSFVFLSAFLFFFSCEKENKENTHREGEMTMYVDPANKNLIEALTEIYIMKFPKVKFNLIYKPENQILKDLLDTVAYAAFINQPLTEQQEDHIYKKTTVHTRSTLLAYDAAIFITSPNNPLDALTFQDLKSGILEGKSQIVFDDGNSGNFNTVIQTLGIKIPKEQSILALDNAQAVIDFVKKSSNAIGVIGLNEISETDNPDIQKLREEIKILSIVDEKNQIQEPSIQNILVNRYPFSKGIYFIVREPGFGIGSGFSRFAGSQQGQLIVRRAGLQPNYLYDREVQINLKNVERE